MNYNQGGFAVRRGQLESIKITVPFNYFLVPNHQDDGYIETLLSNIIVEEYQPALDCLKGQDQCLQAANEAVLQGRKLVVAPQKSADKAIMGAFRTRLKNRGVDSFKDATIWNLNHSYLDPLKNFLETHLSPA